MMVKYLQLFQGQELSFLFVCLFFCRHEPLAYVHICFLESNFIHIALYLI